MREFKTLEEVISYWRGFFIGKGIGEIDSYIGEIVYDVRSVLRNPGKKTRRAKKEPWDAKEKIGKVEGEAPKEGEGSGL